MASQASSKFCTFTQIEEVLEKFCLLFLIWGSNIIAYIVVNFIIFHGSSTLGCLYQKRIREQDDDWAFSSTFWSEHPEIPLNFGYIPQFWFPTPSPEHIFSLPGKTVCLGDLNTNWLYVCSILWLQDCKPWNFNLLWMA